jgi:hypothetical protein
MFKQILGPSPALYGIKKIHSHLFFRGGSDKDLCLADDVFFETMIEETKGKPPRLTNQELRKLLTAKKLTKEQRLVKSVIEEANLSRLISEQGFQNLQEFYQFRRKFKNYLRIKRFIPLCMVAPFTGCELSKMA